MRAWAVQLRQFRPEITAARVGAWSLIVAVLIDSIAHPYYWRWWKSGHGAHATSFEQLLVIAGVIAALIDLHGMLTLEIVWTSTGRTQRVWFPPKNIRVALREHLAWVFDDGDEVVSPATYQRMLYEARHEEKTP